MPNLKIPIHFKFRYKYSRIKLRQMIHKGLTREGKHKERFHGIFVKYSILKKCEKA